MLISWPATMQVYKIIWIVLVFWLVNKCVFVAFCKIIWIVYAFWMIYKCVFIVLWSNKTTSAIWLTVSELWEFTLHASYILFLFVKTKNNDFIKEKKHVVCDSIACWKSWQSLWEFSGRWKTSTASRIFTDLLLNSPKHLPQFSPGYEGTHKNDVSDMRGYQTPSCKNLQFHERNKNLFTRFAYWVFFLINGKIIIL